MVFLAGEETQKTENEGVTIPPPFLAHPNLPLRRQGIK